VVGGEDDIGVLVESLRFQGGQELGKVVVGVADRGKRGRAVNSGQQASKAVALVVLRAVRVARPEHHDERLGTAFEQRQDGIGGDGREPVLLLDVGAQCAWGAERAGLGVLSAGRRLQGDIGLGETGRDFLVKGDAAGAASQVVNDDGGLTRALRVVLDQDRAELADGRRG